jgi:hypothetical protein
LEKTLQRKSLGHWLFPFFLDKIQWKKAYNMLTLMLDSRLNSLKLIYYFMGCEHRVTIAENYDRKSLFLMLVKSYHHLHPLYEAESSWFIELMKIVAWTFLKWWSTLLNLQRSISRNKCRVKLA